LLDELQEKGPEEDEDEDDFARRKMLLNGIQPSEEAKAALTDYGETVCENTLNVSEADIAPDSY
jgi:hypothetical protein